MGVPRHFLVLTSALFVVACLPANGHFLTTPGHGRFWANDHDAIQSRQPDEPKEEVVYEKQSDGEYTDKHKYPFIARAHVQLARVFGKINEHWSADWKLWVGLFFWLAVWTKWVVHGYDEIYYQRAFFAFGINIVILHILQYASSIKTGMFFVCVILSAQHVAQSIIWFKSEAGDSKTPRQEKFTCDCMYLDFSLPAEQIIVLFVSQCVIWWFYMTSILGNFDFNHVNYMFWVVAYLAMQMTMIFNRGDDSVLGNPFPVHEVHKVLLNCHKITFTLEGGDDAPFKLSKSTVIMRGVMGYFCNGILREIMAYTIPLMLMGFAEPMDFVVYCVGVNFICTLDDMNPRVFVMDTDDSEIEASTKEEVVGKASVAS